MNDLIICLNGPPRCGKDTVANLLLQEFSAAHDFCTVSTDKFAAPLDDIAATVLGVDVDSVTFKSLRETLKDEPLQRYPDVTMRKLLIGISEQLIKPLFGPAWFGEQAAERALNRFDLPTMPDIRIMSDTGFQVEYDRFKELVANRRVVLVSVKRKGCDFSGDSREYVKDMAAPILEIHNNGTLEDLKSEVHKLVQTLGALT